MPQINISKSIDVNFFAQLANLGNSWGVSTVSDTEVTLAILSTAIDSVEQALIDYPEAYLAYRKSLKLEVLADIRRVEELKGPMGLVLDDKTILRLSIKCYDLRNHPEKTGIRWEISRGNFAWLDRNTVLGLGDAAIQKVEDCFENVYTHTEAIKAITIDPEIVDKYEALEAAITELNNIDLRVGWPV